MRHNKKHRKLGRTSAHRTSLLINLSIALIQHKRIKTTVPKAKELRPFVEKLVTISKKFANSANPLHERRLLLSKLRGNEDIVNQLVGEIPQKFVDRNGGYTRIIKNGYRPGDNAPMAIIEFV